MAEEGVHQGFMSAVGQTRPSAAKIVMTDAGKKQKLSKFIQKSIHRMLASGGKAEVFHRTRKSPFIAEAVEKVGWRVALEFA